jgi:hypothetical protein
MLLNQSSCNGTGGTHGGLNLLSAGAGCSRSGFRFARFAIAASDVNNTTPGAVNVPHAAWLPEGLAFFLFRELLLGVTNKSTEGEDNPFVPGRDQR